ncbi:MAG TPA: sigma-70 family RNA polymerase sigma factor [Firmicutes bacterium]|nr:sigma-70 family RNA polymerase sigma factor [Bacillota bacterium]
MDINDAELARRIARRDEDAFEELIRRYGGLIKAIVRYHLKAMPALNEDCVNDILFSVWRNINRFDAEKNALKNWLGAVAKYRALNYKRKFYRDLTAGELDENIADEKEIDADILRREIEEETMSLLSGLSEEDRELFIRRYIMDQSIEDISEAADKKPSWVYNRLSRGRRKLRRIYGGKWSGCHGEK